MANDSSAINDHYRQRDLSSNILAALARAGKNIDALTRDDIASFDEFHIQGRQATRDLAHLAGLESGMTVIDIGCGVGGPARTLAGEFGCMVLGIDLVEEYCRTAEMLTERVGLSNLVTFKHGDILTMPVDEETFDVAWMQHMMMNVEDKTILLQKVFHLLRPGGLFALHEIFSGAVSPPYFPVPWAGDSSINFLVSPNELQELFEKVGFEVLHWIDITTDSLDWFRRVQGRVAARPADAPPPLGLNLLMGISASVKVTNVVRNLEDNRIRVVQGVLKRLA